MPISVRAIDDDPRRQSKMRAAFGYAQCVPTRQIRRDTNARYASRFACVNHVIGIKLQANTDLVMLT
jgi:hypothetical protein